FPDFVPGLSINLLLPPKGIALNRKRGDRVPLHLIGIPWFYVWQTLPEGQNIWAVVTLLKRIDEHFRVLYILEPLLLLTGVRSGDPQDLSFDHDSFAIHPHSSA